MYQSLMRMGMLLPPFLIALTVHEFCHALTATYFGDPTARQRGRLTLNPLAHIDPIGLLCLFIFRIGWARPVPFDPHYFKKPRLHSVLVAFAGPCSNFIIAWLSLILLKHLALGQVLMTLLHTTAYINVMLGVFNLLPLHPLDGSHLLDALFIDYAPDVVLWLRRYALFILLFLFYMPPFRRALLLAIACVYSFLEMLVI